MKKLTKQMSMAMAKKMAKGIIMVIRSAGLLFFFFIVQFMSQYSFRPENFSLPWDKMNILLFSSWLVLSGGEGKSDKNLFYYLGQKTGKGHVLTLVIPKLR